jgi:hypothetical protein
MTEPTSSSTRSPPDPSAPIVLTERTFALSDKQTRFIFANVPRDSATNVRVHLALGAEVPPDVELLALPQDVLRRLPEMERYRYIIAGADSAVAIVDPDDNAVVLVINE